jgi:hypothetical protein
MKNQISTTRWKRLFDWRFVPFWTIRTNHAKTITQVKFHVKLQLPIFKIKIKTYMHKSKSV